MRTIARIQRPAANPELTLVFKTTVKQSMARRQLNGKRALVTGASSGIGWHVAMQLAAEGVDLVVTARREERLIELASAIESAGGKCHLVTGDITDPAHREALIEVCQQRMGGLDVLINNAGTTAMGPFMEASPERLRHIFEVNFFAVTELTRLALPLLERGETPLIVNISSVLGHRAAPLKVEYCASKFAVHGFSDALRAELAPLGIELLLVSPSTTDSELFDMAIEDTTETNWKKRGTMSPEKVAKQTVKAIRKRRHEIILTAGGRLIVWLDRLIPAIADRLMARYGQ